MRESFVDVGFAISEKVWREKKKRSADYNGSLALATLEPATIMIIMIG